MKCPWLTSEIRFGINMDGGGGIHPGAPVIWPKPPPVKQSQAAQESARVNTSVSSQTTASQAAESAASAPPPAQAQAPPPPPARPMSMEDVVSELISNNISPTADNKQMASFMMQYGVELSSSNFSELFQMAKGPKNGTQIESAVIALSKGLTGTSKPVDMLANFLSSSQPLGQQLGTIQQVLAGLQSLLQSGAQEALNPGLIASVASVLTSFSDDLKKATKKTESGVSLSNLKSEALLKDGVALQQLLGGLERLSGAQSPQLTAQLAKAKEELGNLISQIAAQAILSKDSERQPLGLNDRYAYWQMPNPENGKSNLEILIKKDPQKKKGDIDPSKTRIMIKVTTEALGEMVIVVDIQDKKVWYIFNTDNEATKAFMTKMTHDLQERTARLSYEMTGFQAIRKRVDIKKYILPTLDLDRFMRIRHEI